MKTAFDDWLSALRLAGKGPVTLPAAGRGLAWSEPVDLAGDWTGATLEGSVTDAPGNAAIVDFAVTGGTYDAGTDTTNWTISLASGVGADSTGVLPADSDADGVTYLPFMIDLTPSGGVKEPLVGGVFQLLENA